MRRAEMEKVYAAKNREEKEAAYLNWIGQFPPKQPGNSNKIYDEARETVALGFARANNVPGALRYLSLIETPVREDGAGVRVAEALVVRGHLAEAERLIKEELSAMIRLAQKS